MVCKLRPNLEMDLGPQISWSCVFGGVGGGAGKRRSWVDLGHSLGMLHVFMFRGGGWDLVG